MKGLIEGTRCPLICDRQGFLSQPSNAGLESPA